MKARFHCHRRISEGPAKVIPIEKPSIPIPKTYGWRGAKGQMAVSRRKMSGTIWQATPVTAIAVPETTVAWKCSGP